MAPAKETLIPRFLWVASGIQLRDSPGKLSMFETEVKFAADCIQTAKRDGPGLVLFDELFHSTNPPDGIRTANLFLKNLWNQTDLFSIVSTHVFPLIKEAPKNVMPICCPATQLESGDITYSFAVQPGVCEVSSVHKVWERFGLSALNETPAKST
jgi:DNA mismatch repair ATPase MutS